MNNNVILCATRFTDKTFNENINYKNYKNFTGALYGSPKKISNNILENTHIIVLEMNISKDNKKILGIGLIKNTINSKIACSIYDKKKFNKYIYYSDYRIDISELNNNELFLIHQLELILYKTKQHIQRSIGITKVPVKLLSNLTNINKIKHLMYSNTINKLLNIFYKKYNNIKF
jgi:hypothetical protein